MSLTRSLLAALAGGAIAAIAVAAIGTSDRHQTRTIYREVAGKSISDTHNVLTPRAIYERTAPGVVAIEATSSPSSQQSTPGFGFFFGQGSSGGAVQSDSGSGIVINRSGLILTNEHVVDGAATITVQFGGSGGATRQAHVVGSDNADDLALISIEPSGLSLHPLALGNSTNVEVGDPTLAIGNPFALDQTLTTGVVSALDRVIQAPDGARIRNVIQTDAALNPGNSGGPLLDATGQVIGVNSQIATGGQSSTGGQAGNVGIGFAIPSNTIRSVLTRMERGAHIGTDAIVEQQRQQQREERRAQQQEQQFFNFGQ